MTKAKESKSPLPEYVHPLGVRFQVQLVELIDEKSSDEEPTWGETDGFSRRIKIFADQDTRRRWTTLLHEYIHATLYTIGAPLSDDIEEMVVQSLEHSIEQFLLAHGDQFLKALEVQK